MDARTSRGGGELGKDLHCGAVGCFCAKKFGKVFWALITHKVITNLKIDIGN